MAGAEACSDVGVPLTGEHWQLNEVHSDNAHYIVARTAVEDAIAIDRGSVAGMGTGATPAETYSARVMVRKWPVTS